MKELKDMTLEELKKRKKMLENDRKWAGIGYGMFYAQQIAKVNQEIAARS